MNENRSGPDTGRTGACSCPFCDALTKDVYPFCKACGKELSSCKVCGKPLPPHRDICEECKD